MGAANVVPGVSGGTIAVITGIYQRLIDALRGFSPTTLKMALRGDVRGALERTDFIFLCALGAGVVLSFVTLAKVLKWGFAEYPQLVWGFFFGLILASVYYVGRTIAKWSPFTVGLFVIGFLGAAGMALLTPASENASFVYLFLCGIVGVCSMLVPGLSGSFVLLLMGNYELIVIDSVNALRSGDFTTAVPVLLPVMLGALAGVAMLAKALSWLFKTYYDPAMGLVTGFITGSLVLIYPWKRPDEVISFEGKGDKIISYAYELPGVTGADGLTVLTVVAGILAMVLTEQLAPERPVK